MAHSFLEQEVKENSRQLKRLESLVEQFVVFTQTAIRELKDEMRAFKDETQNEMRAFKDEMRAFRDATAREMSAFQDEMRAFKEEMRAFKDEMKVFKNEMLAFKDEMKVFKDQVEAFIIEMKAFKDEMKVFRRESQKQWGELANKMGTFAEDIAAPNMLRVAREHAGSEELIFYAVRVKKKKAKAKGTIREFDAIVEYETFVCVNETKTSPRTQDIDAFSGFVESGELQEYFPAYKNKRIVPVFASLYMDPSLVKYASEKKVLVFTMGEDTMDIQNPELFPVYFMN